MPDPVPTGHALRGGAGCGGNQADSTNPEKTMKKDHIDALKAVIALADENKPQGVTDESLTALDTIAKAHRVLALAEKEEAEREAERKALADLIEYSRRVAADICDQDTGWFYQWSSKIDVAERLTTPTA